MPSTRAFRSNPVHLLVVAAAGLAAWVAYDAGRPVQPPAADPPPLPFEVLLTNKRFASLLPGLPRPVVDERLRGILQVEVGPVEATAGGPVYHSRYHVHLHHPLPRAEHPNGFFPGPHVVTLVFDARKPGHPLVGITAVPAEPTPPGAPRAVAE